MGYQMQIWFFNQRLNTYKEAIQASKTAKGVLLDRSVFSDLVFALNSYEDGFISDADFKLYNEQYQSQLKDLPLPTVILYLDATPETCYYRIHNVRCRPCEASIPFPICRGLTGVTILSWIQCTASAAPSTQSLGTNLDRLKTFMPTTFG